MSHRRGALLDTEEAMAALVEELTVALDLGRAVKPEPLRLARAVAERLNGARLPSVAELRLRDARARLPRLLREGTPIKVAARMLRVTPRTVRKIRDGARSG